MSLTNRTFEMSAFSFNARHKSLAKAQNGFTDCLIRQIVSNSLQRHFLLGCILRLRNPLYMYSSPNVVVDRVQVGVVCQCHLGSVRRAILKSLSLHLPARHPAEI